MTQEPTRPSDATRQAERDEARSEHAADRPATPEEERDAEAAAGAPEGSAEDVAAHAKEMAERGAHQKGEGRI